MKQEYYLIPASEIAEIVQKLFTLSDEKNCIQTTIVANRLESYKLIDLSDEAINKSAEKYADKKDDAFVYDYAGYSQALKDIK